VALIVPLNPGTSEPKALQRLGRLHARDLLLLLLIALLGAFCLATGWRDFDRLRRNQEYSQEMIRLSEQALLVSAKADATALSESAMIYSLMADQPDVAHVNAAAAKFMAARGDFQSALNGLAAAANDDAWTLELIDILKREQAAFLDLHDRVIRLAVTGNTKQVAQARTLLAAKGWQLSESISALTQTITLNFSRKARMSYLSSVEHMQTVRWQLAASVLGAIALVALLGWLSHRAWRTTLVEVQRLQHQSLSDPLTGLANRRAFSKRLDADLDRAKREHAPLVLILIDLDHFKQFNDRHGHPAGDALLKDIAALWQPLLRSSDMLARVGGEEFAIIMPGCKANDVEHLLARLRATTPSDQTFSAGVVHIEPHDSIATLIARADRELYAAKRGGRNRTSGRPLTVSAQPA
jgi:diguanylate cyclase (GGDEF)-like protein